MRKYSQLFEKYQLKPYRYEVKGKATIIDTEEGKFVIKEKLREQNTSIYQYLDSRSFHYYPKIKSDSDDDYYMLEYIEQADMPQEQKVLDMIDLVGLLHSKTTHYKEVDIDDYKKIYEDISNNIAYLDSYYTDLITLIESKVFMSPSEYLLARNISKILASLLFAKEKVKEWYDLVKDKRKQRFAVLHNNLEIDHFIKNRDPYLLNWEKSKIDIPIFDFYKFYKKHALEYDFETILQRYKKHYPLLKEEQYLLFLLMAMPDKIELTNDEYTNCQIVSRCVDTLYKSEDIISPYYAKN